MNVNNYYNTNEDFVVPKCRFCDKTPLPVQSISDNYNEHNKFLNSNKMNYLNIIDDIVQSYHCPDLIMCDDLYIYHEEEEFLKRMYLKEEYVNKIKMLSEYYKFHNEVPRIFILSVTETLDNFIDEHRQLNYGKALQSMKKQQPQKKKQTKSRSIKRLIKDINLSYEDFEQREKKKQLRPNKNRKNNLKSGIKQHTHSTQLVGPKSNLTNKIAKSHKNSSKKKAFPSHPIHQNSNKSCKSLPRQKSKLLLECINKPPVKKVLTIHKGFLDPSKRGKQVNFQDRKQEVIKKQRNQSNKDRNGFETERGRCNSKGIIKQSIVPVKSLNINKKQKQSQTNIHKLEKIDKENKQNFNKKRQHSKSTNHMAPAKTIHHLISSHQSNSSGKNRQIFKTIENAQFQSHNSKNLFDKHR